MTALSPDELTLLRLMAEVGAPLRLGRLGRAHFVGRQSVHCELGNVINLTELYRDGLIEQRCLQHLHTPPWAVDYVLTDKGREAAGGGDD